MLSRDRIRASRASPARPCAAGPGQHFGDGIAGGTYARLRAAGLPSDSTVADAFGAGRGGHDLRDAWVDLRPAARPEHPFPAFAMRTEACLFDGTEVRVPGGFSPPRPRTVICAASSGDVTCLPMPRSGCISMRLCVRSHRLGRLDPLGGSRAYSVYGRRTCASWRPTPGISTTATKALILRPLRRRRRHLSRGDTLRHPRPLDGMSLVTHPGISGHL